MKVKSESEVAQLCLTATPWTAAHQAPPSMGFSRQEYWSGVPLPSPDRTFTKPHLKILIFSSFMYQITDSKAWFPFKVYPEFIAVEGFLKSIHF